MNSLCRQAVGRTQHLLPAAAAVGHVAGPTDCPAATLPSDASNSDSNSDSSNSAAAACKRHCCCTCNSFEPRMAK